MPPARGESSNRNTDLTMQVGIWTRRDGAMRSPDASWVRHERLANLTAEQKQRFLPLCPDFVVELRSLSDPPGIIEAKLRECVENGARPGWLIDPGERKVHVYKPREAPQVLGDPDRLSGDPTLRGFVLDLRPTWEPGL